MKRTVEVEAFLTPGGKPTCRTREGTCFLLGATHFGTRSVCLLAHASEDARNPGILYRYEDDGFLKPHSMCFVWPQEEAST